MNASDADAENYIKIFTLHAREFIEDIISRHQAEPHTRLLQKELAKDITIRVHGEENYNNAVSASELLFSKSTKDDFEKLSEGLLLDALEGAPQSIVAADLFENGISFSELITTHTSILASKGEYKRAIQENALSINKEKISDSEYQITKNDLIKGKFLLLQKGKKNYYLIIAQ